MLAYFTIDLLAERDMKCAPAELQSTCLPLQPIKLHFSASFGYSRSKCTMIFFLHLLPKLRTFSYVCLKVDAGKIFHTSYATAGNQTHISSVAPRLRDLNLGRFTD